MKRFFTLLFLCTAGTLFSQTALNRTFLVMYKKQINADSLFTVFRQNRTTADERSRTTLQLLKQISQSSGSEMEAFLQQKMQEKDQSSIKYDKLWIVNAVVVKASSAIAAALEAFPQVDFVEDISDVKISFIEPTRMEPASSSRMVGGVEPGVIAVGTRFLWDLGYTGKGLKLMSFDTGVWPSHPALGGRFYGEYMPLNLAWKGIFSPTPADKSNSHGTHTIGTMSGLDTLTHDTIGIAIKAYAMATDPIVSNLADTIGMPNLMLAYQWVLNPDGDVNTTDDMPAVICNSWGTAPNAGFCNSYVKTMLESIDLTGVANEYSAGNNGPGPSTTGVPALVASGLVNAFAVGAVNGNTPSYPIASFSSRGPSPCASTGALQIKPEVVAPGVDVRSCIKLNEYAFYDGTSMAGPHAAGLLLLLKEAFPTLAGETLKEALYFSAIDLGDPGEDNTYGRGMINAEGAYNWLIGEGYIPVSPVSNVPELVLEKAPEGMLNYLCDAVINQPISIYNEGSVAIQDTVYFKVMVNGNTVGQWAQYVNLAPAQHMMITSPLTVTAVSGQNEVWISARQKNTANEKDMINNNRTTRFIYPTEKTIPYFEDFETDSFSQIQWTTINPDMGRTFELYTTQGQDAGTKSAAMRFINYNPAAAQVDHLISPPIKLNPFGNHVVEFDISYQKRSETQKDSIYLLASLDCGKSFSEVLFAGGPNEMVSTTVTSPVNFTPTTTDHWKRLSFQIPETWNGQTVLFAFKSVNQRGANAYLDDFTVNFVSQASVSNNDLTAISVYPNPFKDVINIQLREQSEQVELGLYDLSGRNLANSLQNNVANISWEPRANLPAGVYILKIKAGNKRGVYKLIKQ